MQCGKGYRLVEEECVGMYYRHLNHNIRVTFADINECETGENTCSHTCENSPGGYECQCPTGFQISPLNSTQCQDIDECLLDNPCSHICFNIPGILDYSSQRCF